jgi:hypothetical protein
MLRLAASGKTNPCLAGSVCVPHVLPNRVKTSGGQLLRASEEGNRDGHVGGAIQRVHEDSTAFVGRQASFLFNVEAN